MELITIEQLQDEFKKQKKAKDIQAFAEKQQQLIQELIKQKKELEEKVSHLETLLVSTTLPSSHKQYSPEEIVCVKQLEILADKSKQRELSLDEVKKLDILVKDLRLIREQSTQVIHTADYRDVKEMDLVAIARNSTEEDQ
jgi:phosphopantetheine adenylyltransferase